ncbi:hypothetical protein YQE_10851, partial [Dendroctonus ponderosae]
MLRSGSQDRHHYRAVFTVRTPVWSHFFVGFAPISQSSKQARTSCLRNHSGPEIIRHSVADDEGAEHAAPTQTHQSDALHNPHPSMIFQNRYQPTNQTASPALLQSNILSAGLSPIAQPYSAEICNYGPVYHPHNILHNYNAVYTNDKSMRPANFGRGMYGGYQGFYNNGNFRSATLTSAHQSGYDFAPR